MILVRSALFNVWFFGATFLIGLFGAFVRWLAPERSLGVARCWARTVLAGARVLCGITVEVTGLERLPAGAALIASQHQSAFDTLIWVVLLPRVSYIYKSELARIPLFGPMLRASGQIMVERQASVASVRALLKATQRAKADGRQIVIFPEGTRVVHGSDSEIRGGFTLIAGRTGLPIYPVSTDSGRYWSRRSFVKRPGRVQIQIGAPIPAELGAAELVAVLRARWREGALTGVGVDKSVDQAAGDGGGAAGTLG